MSYPHNCKNCQAKCSQARRNNPITCVSFIPPADNRFLRQVELFPHKIGCDNKCYDCIFAVDEYDGWGCSIYYFANHLRSYLEDKKRTWR